MKRRNIFIAAIGVTLSFVLMYACQKGFSGLSQAKPVIAASSTNVAVGETVSLTITNAPLATHNVWASTPRTNTLFSAANTHDAANVSFSKPGTYVVTCYFVSGVGADSLPVYDTTTLPKDTVVYYPPPNDSTYNHGDSTQYPGDTTHIPNPVDTTHNPVDTTRNPNPGDTIRNPIDTTKHNPYDSTGYPVDSTHSAAGHPSTTSVSIVIVVH